MGMAVARLSRKRPAPMGRHGVTALTAAAACKKQPALAWVLVCLVPQQPQPHWALHSHHLCPPPCCCLPHSLAEVICSRWPGLWSTSHTMLFWHLFLQCFAKIAVGCSVSAAPLVAGSRDAELWGDGQGAWEWRNMGPGRSFVPPWCMCFFRWPISFTLEVSIQILQLRLSLHFHFQAHFFAF